MTAADLPLGGVAVTPAVKAGWRSALVKHLTWRVLVGSLLAAFALGTLLTGVAWTTFGPEQVGPPRNVGLVIPLGTAAEIAAGGRPTAIPSEIRLTSGDRLVITNNDTVTHTIGGWQVNAGQVLTILADAPATSIFACSIHPSGNLGIIVQARPGLAEALLLILVISLPLSVVLAAGIAVYRMLDNDDLDIVRAD